MKSRFLRRHERNAQWFRAVFALNGFSVAGGVLVVLRYARIPFFLYYPRVVDTVLFSDFLDLYLVFGSEHLRSS